MRGTWATGIDGGRPAAPAAGDLGRCLLLALLTVGLSGTPAHGAPEPGTGGAWVVGEGDSWFSMRSRICPVEDLQAANPDLQSRSLRPGDRIRAPFVSVSLLEAAQAARAAAEQQRAAAMSETAVQIEAAQAARAELQARVAELQAAREELQGLTTARTWTRSLQAALAAGILILMAGLLFAVSALYASRRTSGLREQRLRQLESEHTQLRRSLQDLDVQLQRRMLKLLSWHESRVLSERDVEEATAPVVEMARKLKERHAG